MADTFTLEIATPERLLYSEQATEAQIPLKDGFIGVLPGHAALLSGLGAGVLSYTTASGQTHAMAIRGGFLEILDNYVRVLSDKAERASEVDAEKAAADLKNAQQSMVNPASGIDIAEALIEVKHAQARIDAANQAK
jgi:F-type H+-transporting ATPase subunit epsilon